jgi:hypothetical protein
MNFFTGIDVAKWVVQNLDKATQRFAEAGYSAPEQQQFLRYAQEYASTGVQPAWATTAQAKVMAENAEAAMAQAKAEIAAAEGGAAGLLDWAKKNLLWLGLGAVAIIYLARK